MYPAGKTASPLAGTYDISRAIGLAVVNPQGTARFRARNRIALHATFKAALSRKMLTQRPVFWYNDRLRCRMTTANSGFSKSARD
jgi:hypothetical protein